MTTLFISDLHLDDSRPHITTLFQRFLATQARKADALYILGDLFESWIGDDDDAPLANTIANALLDLKRSGVPCHFMHGNRDFLLGETYAERAGFSLLNDPTVIDLYGVPTALVHGDALCTDDHAYQAFRQQVRNPFWQQGFLAQPLATRREMARQARTESQRHTAAANMEIMDVNAAAVARAMHEAGVHRLIHGHTHRPATHSFQLNGLPATRIVLGDWYEQGSVLTVDADHANLIAMAID